MNKYSNKHSGGYLMIEVLVSMIVIFIGVVGIAKLQHVAKNTNAQAIQRTLASNLTDSLIERIRSNLAGVETYFPLSSTKVLNGSLGTPSKLCTSVSICTPDELATFEICEWDQHLTGSTEQKSGNFTGGLVDPIVCLLGPSGGGDGIYHIAIVWHGLTPLQGTTISNTNASDCGTLPGQNSYDSVGTNDNVYRRIHWQQVFFDV
jgi:type IV pilus assembly protein PilV